MCGELKHCLGLQTLLHTCRIKYRVTIENTHKHTHTHTHSSCCQGEKVKERVREKTTGPKHTNLHAHTHTHTHTHIPHTVMHDLAVPCYSHLKLFACQQLFNQVYLHGNVFLSATKARHYNPVLWGRVHNCTVQLQI